MTAATVTVFRAGNTRPRVFGSNRAARRAARQGRRRRSACSRVPASTTDGFNSRRGSLFLNNRYHDPQLGVFISVDPLVNRTGEAYIYGSANPITKSDPTGLCSMISGDLWCGGHNFTLAENCVSGRQSCSDATIRTGYAAMRYTAAGKAIFAALDVAHQGDWSKVDGNLSGDDIGGAASGTNLLGLLGDRTAADVVQRVGRAYVGQKAAYEALDVDPSFWDRHGGTVLAAATLVLDVVSVVGAASCAVSAGAGCAVSLVSGLGASALGVYGLSNACTSSNPTSVGGCGGAVAGSGSDLGSFALGQAGDSLLGRIGPNAARRGGAVGNLVASPFVVGSDLGLLVDAWGTNPLWYPAPNPSTISRM